MQLLNNSATVFRFFQWRPVCQSVSQNSREIAEIQVPGSFAAIYYIMHASHFSIPDPSRDRKIEKSGIESKSILRGRGEVRRGLPR